jgi:hypothetical protein
MKAPVILSNYGDVLIFDSIEKAERYIEPIDVTNNEYIAYDSEGRLLRLVEQSRYRVIVEPVESDPSHRGELREILVDFLARIGVSQNWLAGASLEDLVTKGLEYKTE